MINTKNELEQFLVKNWDNCNQFLDEISEGYPLPFYNSIDIRESAEKFAPVDNNLYPAGFNNLCLLDLEEAGHQMSKIITSQIGQNKKIGLLGESHTKNLFYLDNLSLLKKSLEDQGYLVDFITLDEALFTESGTLELESMSGYPLKIHQATIKDQYIYANNNQYEFVILNNDQSSPFNVEWNELKTTILPSPLVGWNKRKKIDHFKNYDLVLQKFCEKFEINSDLMQAKYDYIDGLDFIKKDGFDELEKKTNNMLSDLKEGSAVYVKANSGTYGMGISVIRNPSEISLMNRKSRNKMNAGKNNIKFDSVLIQEGIDTIIKYDDQPAEITIYTVASKPVGGFMRVNSNANSISNLNSKGMVFQKFCISEIRQNNDHKCKEIVYSIIAKISSIACAYETKAIMENQ